MAAALSQHGKPAPEWAEDRWRWPVMLALAVTIPAFYLEMAASAPRALAATMYLVARCAKQLALRRARHKWQVPTVNA